MKHVSNWIQARDTPAARTLASVFLLILVFVIEDLTATSLGYQGPHNMLRSAHPPASYFVMVLSPILHSGANHLVYNLFWFVPLSSIFARRVQLRQYAVFLYVTGFVANLLFPVLFLLFGLSAAPAIGASSVTHALAGREASFRLWRILRDLLAGEHVADSRIAMWAIVGFVALLDVWILVRGQTPAGGSVPAHLGGLVLGFCWAINDIQSCSTRIPQTQFLFTAPGNGVKTMFDIIRMLLFLIIILALYSISVLGVFFNNMITRGTAIFLIQIAGTLGTLLFIAATFLTVRQNKETLQELRKDREKQVVIDEIQQVIQPAIDRIDKNVQKLEVGFVGWEPRGQIIPSDGEEWKPTGGLSIKKPVLERVTDEAALQRSKERNPDLHSHLNRYDKKIDELTESTHEVIRIAGPPVAEKVEEDIDRFSWSQGSMNVSNGRFLSYLVDEQGWKYRDRVSGWNELMEEHADEFWEIMNETADSEFQQLRDKKSEVLGESKEIRDELISVRNNLQQEYGISLEEFQ